MQLRPCRLEALSGSAGYARLRATIVSSGLVVLLLHSAGVFAQARCPQPAARAASVEGRVEVRANPQAAWQPLRPDDTLCAGDAVQVLERSRAGLLLANDVLLRLDQNSVLMLGEADPEKPSVMEFLRGWLHVITRHRKQFRVTTPVANAMVEGTEFTISAEPDRSSVTVDEGRVQMQSRGGTLALESGQAGEVRGTGAPQAFPRVRPLDAVQWALYFPPVLRYRPSLKDPVFSKLEEEASKLALEGDASGALERVGQIPPNIRTESLRTFEASLLLSVGRVDEAAAILKAQSASSDPDALALDAILQLIAGDRSQAAARAEAAVRARPTAAALLARSFVQQSQFKLEDALQSVKRATEVEPDNAIAWARLSELQLSIGEVGRAREAAERAVELSPRFGRGHTILGFVLLAQGEFEEAQQSFDKAVASLQGDPLPRLGKGLAFIRRGNLAEGRRELELAVLLDPGNSLLRSYLGKAYSEELRDELADAQLGIAKKLDPLDPTPWFYNAIRLQAVNRPGEALQELQESIARNENRAVYRSRLLLDQDQAARSASQALIYSDLGFDQLAVTEAMNALDADPRRSSAHRFLAEAYESLPRYEAARVSELLQSQLLQPANTLPVPTRLGAVRAPIPQGSGPTAASFQELTSLFARDGHWFGFAGVGGSDSTIGEELQYALFQGQRTVQLGQFHFETLGVQPNADLKQDILRLFYQEDVSYRTSLQAEARTSRTKSGDILLQFDPQSFETGRQDNVDSARVGFRHSPAPDQDWLVSVITQKRDSSSSSFIEVSFEDPDAGTITTRNDFARQSRSESRAAEIQHLRRTGKVDLTAGAGAVSEDVKGTLSTQESLFINGDFIFSNPPVLTSSDSTSRYDNVYLYGSIRAAGLTVTAGASSDDSETRNFSQRKLSPKLGVRVPLGAGLVLRAAAFRNVARPAAGLQTLEPTQVAGFNQLFDDAAGTRSSRLGIALDGRWGRALFAGVEATSRALEVPILASSGGLARFENRDERLHRAYVSWVVSPRIALGAEYRYELEAREVDVGQNFPVRVTTHYLPLTMAFHDPSGVYAKLRATFVDQTVVFRGDSTVADREGQDRFHVVDLLLGYRLPRREGVLSLTVKNLFDERFRFQDTDLLGAPRVPFLLPGRALFFTFSVTS